MPLSYPLTLPAVRGSKQIKMVANTQAAMSQSPFSGVEQVQEWPGEWWELQASLPAMKRADAEQWIAFLLALRGRSGTFYFGPSGAAAPQGAGGANVKINGTVQGPKVLLFKGFANSTLVLKAGDLMQVGAGAAATRITTSGGTNVRKYFYDTTVHPSLNGQKYVASVRIKNIGAKTVRVTTNTASVQDVAAGTEVQVLATITGDGASNLQFTFDALLAGDALDFIAWAPQLQRQGLDENFIPVANQNFTGWTAFSGAVVTLVQNYNQRLYKSLTDVTSDGSGNAAVEIFPRWRTGDAVADGDPVTLTNCKGIFRLADNRRGWDEDESSTYYIDFKAVEALKP
jgi:hypothetical protein